MTRVTELGDNAMSGTNKSEGAGCGCLILIILAGLIGYGVFALIHYVISPGSPHSTAQSHSATSPSPSPTHTEPRHRPETSASPSPSPTPTPTPTRQVDLATAVKHGLVSVQATGDGLQSMQLSLSSKSRDNLDVTVPADTIFGANSSSVQSMVTISATDVPLNPGDSGVPLTVNVACTNMTLDEPSSSDTFDARAPDPSSDLYALVNLGDFQKASFDVQQFAIWTITDNPQDASSFTGISDSPSGPSSDQISQIRQLFTEATIDTSKYSVFTSQP
jgi:hypothetical protein